MIEGLGFDKNWGRYNLVFIIFCDFPESNVGSDVGVEIYCIEFIRYLEPFFDVG